MGVSGPGVYAVNYLLPPNDAYYTYFNCGPCDPDSSLVGLVRVALSFPVACDQPVAVSIVGAKGDTSCFEPDTMAALSSPETFHLVAAAPGSVVFDLLLTRPVRVKGDLFLCVSFAVDGGPECSTLATRPRLITTASCPVCRSWNYSVAGNYDLCRLQLPGQPVMSVGFDVCVVPTRQRTWGELKLLYR